MKRFWFAPLTICLFGVACGAPMDDGGTVSSERGPLGKADAPGSCLADDGDDFCGGKSDGACWCDELCEGFGDCCSDVADVCEGEEEACCDPDDAPGANGNPFCIEGASCCADGSWNCNNGAGQPTCDAGTVCGEEPACCDPDEAPGANGNPFCIEGATCCSDGSWNCNNGAGQPTCTEGDVCEAEGCLNNGECADAEYCAFESECGEGLVGECTTRPEACILLFDPVCGCDGETYGNGCLAANSGISVQHDGECEDEPPPPPPDPNSCEDNCGGQAPGGCWCDGACTFWGDCCDDIADAC